MKNTTNKSNKNDFVVIPQKNIKKVRSQIDGFSVYQITTSDVKLQERLSAYVLEDSPGRNMFEVSTKYVNKTKSGYRVEIVKTEQFMKDHYAAVTFGHWAKDRPTLFVKLGDSFYKLKPTITIPPEIARFRIRLIGIQHEVGNALRVEIVGVERTHQFLDWIRPPCIFKFSEYKQKPGVGIMLQSDNEEDDWMILHSAMFSTEEIGYISLQVIKCVWYEDNPYILVKVLDSKSLDPTAPYLDINKLSYEDLSGMYLGFDTWVHPEKLQPPLTIV